MSGKSDNTKAHSELQVLDMVLLSIGLYAIVLGLTCSVGSFELARIWIK